jgi:hypothetical protein
MKYGVFIGGKLALVVNKTLRSDWSRARCVVLNVNSLFMLWLKLFLKKCKHNDVL